MRRIVFLVVAMALLAAPAAAQPTDDISRVKACKFCGMNREMYAHSRVFIEYTDGSSEGNCSIHCASVELALTLDKFPKTIWVGDYNAKTLTDGEKAIWVIGGGKPGVMTKRPKWAFAKKEDADAFIAANGGEIRNFEEIVKASYEDMYDDTRMIRDRREAKRRAAAEKK